MPALLVCVAMDVSAAAKHPAAPARRLAAAGFLLLAATAGATWLDQEVSLTSQAMIYVLAVVLASYRLNRVESGVFAIAAVTAFNFFFVPPRLTFEVEHREHFIALLTMLAVALLISHLASSVRREADAARRSERRARELQDLATRLDMAATEHDVLAQGEAALRAAFAGPCRVVLADEGGALGADADLPPTVRDGLRCCVAEAAALGPGTGRWPGLDAWYLPLGAKGRIVGAACVQPALAADVEGREQAQALCALLGQAVWRLRLSVSMLAAQAQAQRQQLQATFLAAVSHDLRTPLAAIVGAASSLQSQRDRLGAAEKDRLLGSIAGEALYLSSVAENTLQLVRLSDTTLRLRRDWESIEEIVGSVLARVRQRDPDRRIKSRVTPGLPLVRADAVLLAQLLDNLLDNALKYSDGAVDLVVSADARELHLAVKDRGPGVELDDRQQAFEPFVRGKHSGRRGAGLGLAVCRAVAEAHGGRLTVRPRGGGGSSFCLALPIEAEQPAADAR